MAKKGGGSKAASEGVLDSLDTIENLDDQTRASLTQEVTLALLYLTSTPASGGTLRRAKKGMGADVLRGLDRERLIEMPRQGPVTITSEGCERALGTIAGLRSALATRHAKETAKEAAKAAGERAFRFRVELELWPEHPCWREIVIAADATFEDFHQAIQSAFLWWYEHCYDFELTSKGKRLKVTGAQGGIDMMFSGLHGGRGEEVRADGLLLSDVFPRTRTAHYTYDYGDDWEHDVRLVETIEGCTDELPFCSAGEGDAPPEDVGSTPGFEDFLRIIADRHDPEHAETLDWAKHMGYEPFDLNAVNRRMRKWKNGELSGFGW